MNTVSERSDGQFVTLYALKVRSEVTKVSCTMRTSQRVALNSKWIPEMDTKFQMVQMVQLLTTGSTTTTVSVHTVR